MNKTAEQDPQYFEEHKLTNGITVYSHAMDVPFFDISVVLPFGSAEAIPENSGGINGVAHFLEHVVLNRSDKYPEKESFTQSLSLKGAYVNASTGPYRTRIYGSAPIAIQNEMVSGLFDHVWHPILTNKEDLAIERTIVGNERSQRKYYPGNSEVTHYLFTKWMYDVSLSKRQVFGTDEDLNAMTPEVLTKFHENYFTDAAYVVVGGGHDLAPILKELEAIKTHHVALAQKVEPLRWEHKEFHQHAFKDIDIPTYYYGGIIPSYDFEFEYTIGFILSLIANHVHGPLHEWTRKEKGWTYGISRVLDVDADRMSWWLKLPLNHIEPLEEIRSQMDERIREALRNPELIKKEIKRREFNDIYDYQTLDVRISSALSSLQFKGRILLSEEYSKLNNSMNNPAMLQDVYEKYMRPEMIGEFLAVPEE